MFELHVLDVSGPETFVMVKDALSLNFCQKCWGQKWVHVQALCIYVSPCHSWFAADAFASGWAGTSSFDLPYVWKPEHLFLLHHCWQCLVLSICLSQMSVCVHLELPICERWFTWFLASFIILCTCRIIIPTVC